MILPNLRPDHHQHHLERFDQQYSIVTKQVDHASSESPEIITAKGGRRIRQLGAAIPEWDRVTPPNESDGFAR
jgi:hypothetical protein